MSRQLVLFILSLVALAAMVPAVHAESEIASRVRTLLEGTSLPDGADVEITVGDPDPRLVLAPCRTYEPFVPTGARLWGRTSLGVRCTDGATWTIYLPTHIKVYAPALVASRPLVRGQTITAEDVRIDRVELTAQPAGVLGPADALDGRTLTRAMTPGEPLRRDLLRAPNVVQAGEVVLVRAAGPGFSISTEGKALAAATDGQTTQIAVGGKVLSGVARTGKIVEVR
ncbi:MAG TPA: flagellar basal body P-ring formation chaperone FlgA [Casimicrobiaceae bacterium]|nr:flagellar basal body P-ring formation chaperone FlgA [Casimicrobiaceae bacterium]